MEAGLIAVPMGAEEARPFLEKAARFDTSLGLLTAEEMTRGAVWRSLERDGERVGAYALSLSQHDRGSVLWMVALAAGVPGEDLSPHILNIVEQQAAQVGAAQVAITSRRPGAVKKLLAHGYEISGITLRKKI